VAWLLNLRDRLPGAAKLSEATAGFSAQRKLPRWRRDYFREPSWPGLSGPSTSTSTRDGDVVLFADTFNRYFEPENLAAAATVLEAAGKWIVFAKPRADERPICCGRTFLAVGKVDEARREAEQAVAQLEGFAGAGLHILGLEPSCTFTFRDEIPALLKTDAAKRVADQTLLFEEYLAREAAAGRLDLKLSALKKRLLLHGHCHQKSFDTMGAVETALRLVPDLDVEKIESSCCGMAGAFGYDADTIEVSRAMGELSLLPAVRKAPDDAIIVADGTSCRQQIRDGSGREAVHVARVLAAALPRS
jgi:Fe-S oxidoreductase